MARVAFSGAVPSSIPENAVNSDWAATLALTGNLAALRSIELVGPGALFFAMRWDAGLGVVFLEPGAAADYEGLTYNGGDPTIAFGLRYTYTDGTSETDATTIRVGVTNADDTPPQGLRFLSGGTIRADQLGGVIGTLAVDDPDTEGPFGFYVIGWDDWMFEFDGMALRLRDGVNIGLDAIPTKPLIIEVSDGRQSAAFVLDIQVTDPNAPPSLPILATNLPIDGVTALGDGRAVTLRDAADFVALPAGGNGAREIVAGDAPAVLLTAAEALALRDGLVGFAADGAAARAVRLHLAIEGAAPDAVTLAGLVVAREAGAAWVAIAAGLLADEAPITDAAFFQAAYRAGLGRDPSGTELARDIAAGRAQAAVDLAFGAEAVANNPVPPDGIWVALPLGLDALPDWQADRGGIGPPPTVPPPSDVFFA